MSFFDAYHFDENNNKMIQKGLVRTAITGSASKAGSEYCCFSTCPDQVVRMMKKLLFSQDCADVIFENVPCGEHIFAHKCILAAASLPMKALVTGQWLENQNDGVCLVKVEHSAVAMKAMLKFIYVGTIEISNLDDETFELLDLAAQYDLPELSTACETLCIKLLQAVGGRSDRVVATTIAAYVYEKSDMKTACINYIKSKGPTMMMSNAFMEMKTSHSDVWMSLRKDLGVPDEELV